jgi:hypothetical protein
MGEARGLKETSEPEYQEKLERIKQLKDLRGSYVVGLLCGVCSLQGVLCWVGVQQESNGHVSFGVCRARFRTSRATFRAWT